MTSWKVAACAVLCSWSAASHAAVVIIKDTSTVQSIPGLTTFVTMGDDMAGLQVTASFAGGLTETLFWSARSSSGGGVTGSGWSLTQTGDTYGSPWRFSMGSGLGPLTQFVLDASGPGQFTVFDTLSPNPGTVNSSQGLNFAFGTGCDACEAAAVYSNAVAIDASRPAGDLFHTLSVSFLGGSGPTGNFTFLQDTDSDIRLVTNDVPEPSSLALLAAGGVGLLVAGRRRSRRAYSACVTSRKSGSSA